MAKLDMDKHEVIEDLGLFKFNDGNGIWHFEIVRYDGGKVMTSYRNFYVNKTGEVAKGRSRTWISQEETEALQAGFQAATDWFTANPQEKGDDKAKRTDAAVTAMTARLKAEMQDTAG